MDNIERLWLGTSEGEVFEIGYNTMMKLAEEKLMDRARTVQFRLKVQSGVIQRFYLPRRGIIMQLVQHPFDGGFIICGFNPRRKNWYIWV
jgi:hypothetical protein